MFAHEKSIFRKLDDISKLCKNSFLVEMKILSDKQKYRVTYFPVHQKYSKLRRRRLKSFTKIIKWPDKKNVSCNFSGKIPISWAISKLLAHFLKILSTCYEFDQAKGIARFYSFLKTAKSFSIKNFSNCFWKTWILEYHTKRWKKWQKMERKMSIQNVRRENKFFCKLKTDSRQEVIRGLTKGITSK